MTKQPLDASARCPCGHGSPYGDCCGPLHAGVRAAPTALQLMRSRYSAFAAGNVDYLRDTWHPTTRPSALELDGETIWLRLLIEGSTGGGPFDQTGTVTFTAIGRGPDGRFEQHERSRFERIDDRWFYVDGE